MSEKHLSYREESRLNYGLFTERDNICDDQLKIGALLRIADATEVMAENHQSLIDSRDKYKSLHEKERETTARMAHRISGLQGHITRLKNKRSKK